MTHTQEMRRLKEKRPYKRMFVEDNVIAKQAIESIGRNVDYAYDKGFNTGVKAGKNHAMKDEINYDEGLKESYENDLVNDTDYCLLSIKERITKLKSQIEK
jgi:hypothetical protein